ncbi:allophanate hydrolase subunit 2-domain-containing protein [Boletus reticuloceps]|uniref:Allophanate hydrolase subunit 2-domain-containing protein n=1 Tax=Boletus reticuloceps TaxID=495285 RepID=A0A8I3A8P3_9AGAM|nr:allophanate hydrolase subunit 2-domain-containing protein [Boletus reticuloceps]
MECRGFYGGHKLLVANRGEIAVRVLRTAKHLGISTIAVYSPSDALSPHVSLADEAALLKDTSQPSDGQPESKLYLSLSAIIAVCKDRHVTMVHPGYGFLSENPDFAQAVVDAGMIWLGPQPNVIRAMGLKHEARTLAAKAGLPLVPGSQGLVNTQADALRIASEIGFPVMLKATAGGGGMGLVICNDDTELSARYESTRERAETLFRHEGVFIERYYPSARHIEVQVFGNGIGDVVHMGERECSVQRRHQKVIEEAPSPFFSRYPKLRQEICDAAVRLCRSIKYSSAGTVEFLMDGGTGDFFFLEMNTRIQVEHPITEAIHPGLDLVELMIAQGVAERTALRGLNLDSPTLSQGILDANLQKGATHAIEARIYSENPANGFQPCAGMLQQVDLPEQDWLRIDHWISTGTNIATFFDPLLCKLIVKGETREEAVFRLQQALSICKIHGPPNNVSFLRAICESPTFKNGGATTTFLDTFEYTPRAFTVVSGGIEATIQDLPGRRIGLGMPQSGPMDPQAFKAANVLVGNHPETESLEIVTLPGVGCKFTFHVSCLVAVTGKAVAVKVNRELVPMWARLVVPAKGILEIAGELSNGFRVYLAIRGGFPEVPQYLGSKSTSMGLGGYQGRALKPGDQIALGNCAPSSHDIRNSIPFMLPTALVPIYPKDWVVDVLPGPQDDEEFLTPEGNASFYSTQWTISSASNRMGIRLQSKNRIQWARTDGGEGGSHPSNILDNGYALGTVNLNGDTPGDSYPRRTRHGGLYMCLYRCVWRLFVSVLIQACRWKLGQLSPGGTVQFKRISWAEAQIGAQTARAWIEDVRLAVSGSAVPPRAEHGFQSETTGHLTTILQKIMPPAGSPRPVVAFRQAGDSAILVEYGQMKLDFDLRARVHALETEARKRDFNGIWSFAPCIRSTMCHFDPVIISQKDVLEFLAEVENLLPDTLVDIEFPGRKIVFPIALDDRWNREALERYMTTIRSKAVYLPSNIDYLAQNNGLEGGATEALEKLMGSSWLVFGVGFYLALPFLQIDPRCRLVGQKMNPSRTFTPSGAVGIAGPVAAIYPVVSPGGYQLFGRTLPAWQTWGKGADFNPERPWLLRPFDQVSFMPVTEDRYIEIEQEFNAGQIEPTVFSMATYTGFVKAIANQVAEFTDKRAEAAARVGARENMLLHAWLAQKELEASRLNTESTEVDELSDCTCVSSSMSASVWKIKCQTEIDVPAGEENIGKVVKGLGKDIREGVSVQAGDPLVWVS